MSEIPALLSRETHVLPSVSSVDAPSVTAPPGLQMLIETAVGKSQDVVSELRELSWVEMVVRVVGPYDVIAIVSAPDLKAVGDLISSRIHKVEGIVRTVTCMTLPD